MQLLLGDKLVLVLSLRLSLLHGFRCHLKVLSERVFRTLRLTVDALSGLIDLDLIGALFLRLSCLVWKQMCV